jgi:hypothetical protein
MEKDSKKPIEEIIGGMKCPKDFNCYKSGFENLCKAEDIGLERFLECLEEDWQDCHFSFRFGYLTVCECPLRVYIAKTLKQSE